MLERNHFHVEAFGENIYFFSPEDKESEMQAALNEIYLKQESAQFGEGRYAVYFLPGEYPETLRMDVGFYTQAAGLGILPQEVRLPFLQCTARWNCMPGNHNATCNFWRGVENMTLESDTMWAVSQATYMRRMHIKGSLFLHDEGGWASGGFMADSKIEGTADSGTQQQWLSRNCDWNVWSGENWNIVFAGVEEGKAPTETWPVKTYTTVDRVERIREKPFLVYDEESGFGVYVPSLRTNCSGVSWETEGKVIPMKEFYIARPETDTADTLNRALAEGKHLFFTPGIYYLDRELGVGEDQRIILGTGLATLIPCRGNCCIRVTGEETILAGLLFDAGEQCSDTLLEMERTESGKDSYLYDLFFRVGGAADYETKVHSCLVIHRDHVIGDNFWIWRADHGSQVAWDKNTAENGMIVNGNHVTVYALMVEHFQEYQTVWNGEDGKVIMYQSELPYDVPDQESWQSHEGEMNGYASYFVAPDVERHEAWGLGIYSVFWDAVVEEHCVMEVPETPAVRVHNICAVMINGNPGISHVINHVGESCMTRVERHIITDWPLQDLQNP